MVAAVEQVLDQERTIPRHELRNLAIAKMDGKFHEGSRLFGDITCFFLVRLFSWRVKRIRGRGWSSHAVFDLLSESLKFFGRDVFERS